MKKFVTFLLVLGLASVASAGTMNVVGLPAGPLDSSGGDIVLSLDIVSNGQLDNATMYVYADGGALDIASAINNVVPGEIYDDAENMDYLADCGIDTSGLTQPVIWAEIAIPHVPSLVIEGDILSDIGLTIPMGFEGMITVSALNENDCSVQGVASVEVIPEPITIALLGLGGLFLRRRL